MKSIAFRGRGRHALTLLEVVICLAIVAVATSMLIPAVQKVRAVATGTSCQANLRTLSTAFSQYTSDYNDSYPYGFMFAKQNPATGRPINGPSGSQLISWFSSLDKYLTAGGTDMYVTDASLAFYWAGPTQRRFNATLHCPAVPSNYRQQTTYYENGVAMPMMPMELGLAPAGQVKISAPARVSQLYPDTALLWDTNCWIEAEAYVPSFFWLGPPDQTTAGFTQATTDIDYRSQTYPKYPELRFRSPGRDRFAASTNPLRNSSGPIVFRSDVTSQQGGIQSQNADAVGITWAPGDARFRHDGLGCNVLFADGSVRTLFLHPDRIVYTDASFNTYIDSDFRRSMLMINWPVGLADSNQVATNSSPFDSPGVALDREPNPGASRLVKAIPVLDR